jgi:uncharacterized protein YdeI (BOF family)
MTMTKTKFTWLMFVAALAAVLCLASLPAFAQSASDPANAPTAQQQQMPPDNQNASSAASEQTFSGKIVKMGSKLVLTDASNKTTYQLDDQQKAQDFVNKNVKVTGVLDTGTGTIRVSAIGPA